MDIRKLQFLIVDALEDVKAQDIQTFDTTEITSLFDRVVVASGTSNRQTRALAASVRDKVKAAGGYISSVEGEDTGEWVLVDCGDAIVHIMQPVIRQYYRLEEIWGNKPVDVKRQYKAFQSDGSPDMAPARKAPKRKAMSKSHTAAEAMREGVSVPEISPTRPPLKAGQKRKPSELTSGTTRGTTKGATGGKPARPAAKKTATRYLPPARKPGEKVYVIGKAPPGAKKPAAKKVAAKTAASKTVAAKAAPAKKVAVKKAPAKKAAVKTTRSK